jgi:Aspartyl/Asparaginyl beta-hydroxylase
MRYFLKLAEGLDVLPLLAQLHRQPDLWDRNSERRLYPGTPHGAMVDITARYMPQDEVTIDARRAEHRNVFWPAWYALPALRPLVFALMARVEAVDLGSILITRLPPGGKILPHSDAGSWAPGYYHCKCHITLAGSALVSCEDEVCRFDAGSVWTFDNLLVHAVENTGDSDRIVVIVSMRCQ